MSSKTTNDGRLLCACVVGVGDVVGFETGGRCPETVSGRAGFDCFLRPERRKLNSPATCRLLPNADELERGCGADMTGHLF
jgi:hypothetical protein